MAIDTSMYQNSDPDAGLNRLTGFMQLKGMKQQNQLQALDLQGQQGISDLYKNAPKDADGNPDPNYIIQNAGMAGVHAPAAIQGAMAIQQRKLDIQRALTGLTSDKLELGHKINTAITSTTVPLLSDLHQSIKDGTYDPDQFRARVGSELANVVAASADQDGNPVITPQRATDMLKNLNFDDPQGLATALANRVSTAQAWDGHLQDALTLKRGQMGTANVGVGDQPTLTDVISGETKPVGPVIPTGASYVGGRQQYNANVVPKTNPFNPQNPQNPNNTMPQQSPTIPNGAAGLPGVARSGPTVPSNPNAFAQSNAAAAPALPPNYVAGQLDPAQKEVNDTIEHGNQIIKLEPSLKGVLQYADAGGPNAELSAKVMSALKDTSVGKLFDVNTDPQARLQILDKFTSDATGQNMSANAKNQLESSVQAMSNPNSKQFPQALKTVAKFLLARTNAAKQEANYLTPLAGDPNVSAEEIRAAQKEWRDNYDQNVYELKYMNDDEKKNLATTMQGKDKDDFEKKLGWAAKHGLVNPDDF